MVVVGVFNAVAVLCGDNNGVSNAIRRLYN